MASIHFPASSGSSWWRPFLIHLLAITGLVGLAGYQSKLHHEQQARISAENVAQLLGKHISGVIEKIDLSLRTTVLEVERQQARGRIDPKLMEQFLAQQKSLLPDVDSLVIVDKDGTFRHSAGKLPDSSISLADRDYFVRLQADPGAGLAVSGPYQGRASRQWLMIFARRLNRPDGSFAGTVLATVRADRFREMMSSLNLGTYGAVGLRTADARLVARFPHGEKTGEVGNRQVSAEYRQSLLINPEQGIYYTMSPVDQAERTVAYQRIPGLPLYVGVGLASQDYLAAWREQGIKLAAMVALFGLVALWLLRSARRAEQNSQATQQLLQEAVNSIAIGFSIFDSGDRLVVCNEAAREFLAQSRDMLVPGTRFEDIVRTAIARDAYPEASGRVDQWVSERMRLHRAADGKPFERTLNDGRRLLISERRTASGYTVTNWIDITELAQHRCHLEQLVDKRTAELKAASDQFRIFVEQSPAAIAMFDRDLRYIAASHRWIADHAGGRSGLAGQAMYEMHPDIPERWQQLHREALAGTASRGDEDAWLHADGSRRWLRWAIHPWIDGSGQVGGIIIATEDFTEQKETEEKLRLVTERFDTALRNSPVMAYSQDREMRFTWVYNPGMGYRAEEFLGKRGTDFFPPEDAARLDEIKREVMATGQSQRREVKVHYGGGDRYYDLTVEPLRDAAGQIDGVSCAAVDLTESKATEEALRRSEERLRMALKAARMSIFEYDPQTDRVYREGNMHPTLDLPTACSGSDYLSRVHPDDQAILPTILENLSALQPTSTFEYRVQTSDGQSYRWIADHVRGEFEGGIQLVRVVGISVDVTERHRAEMEIQRLNANLELRVEERTAELEASNKELQGFIHAASHDMKGPLGRISSFAGLMERNYRHRMDGDGPMFLDFIRRNATRLNTLIDDLLAHAQIDQRIPDIRPVDLPAAVREILEEKQDDIRIAGAQVWLDLPPEVEVNANPHGLAQVLRSLVGNALKYSAPATPPVIEIGGHRTENICRFWIRDNGIGFDMAYHDKIFEIFRRLHTYDEIPGSGIGLALAKKAMERMGGRIWAESTPGHGATFFLELQLSDNFDANEINYHL